MRPYTPKKSIFLRGPQKKSSVARVRLFPGRTGEIKINNLRLIKSTLLPRRPGAHCMLLLEATNTTDKFDIECTVRWWWFHGQAGAIRHGIARALPEGLRKVLFGFQGCWFPDPRPKNEGNKKYGLKLTSCTSVQQEIRYQNGSKTPENQGFPGFTGRSNGADIV